MDTAPKPSLQERYAGLVVKPTYWPALKDSIWWAVIVGAGASAPKITRGEISFVDALWMIPVAAIAVAIVWALPVWAWRLYRWRQDVKDAMLDPDWLPRHLR